MESGEQIKFKNIIPVKYIIPTKSKRYFYTLEKGAYIKNKWTVNVYDKVTENTFVVRKDKSPISDNNFYDLDGISDPNWVIKGFCFDKPEKALELLNKYLEYKENQRIKYGYKFE